MTTQHQQTKGDLPSVPQHYALNNPLATPEKRPEFNAKKAKESIANLSKMYDIR